MMALSIQHSSQATTPSCITHEEIDQTCSPTQIQPSQAIHMFSESMSTRMRVDGKGDESSSDSNSGSNGNDNSSKGEGNGSNSNNDNDSNDGDNEDSINDNEDSINDNDTSSGILLMDMDGNDIIPPAITAHCKRVHLQQEMQQEVVIDPALLTDQYGGQLLPATLSTSSASVLVTTEQRQWSLHTIYLRQYMAQDQQSLPQVTQSCIHQRPQLQLACLHRLMI